MKNKNIFSEKDYNSGEGMITYIWGPPFWYILHTISFNYPINPTNKEKKDYYNFYNNLQNILPCKPCRDNLKIHYDKFPLNNNVFKNRYNLSKYIYNLHELVNTLLNKKSNLSYENVRDIYEQFRFRNIIDPNNTEYTESFIGIKSKCVLNIVPFDNNNNNNSLLFDPKCKIFKKVSKKSSKKVSKKSSKKVSKQYKKKNI